MIDWKLLFRNQLLDTKNSSDILTIFDNERHQKLIEITENNIPFGPDEYLQSWFLQGDEKYNGLLTPREDLIYSFSDFLLWVSRFHAINTNTREYKSSQLWKVRIINNNKLIEYPVISSMCKDHTVKHYNIPEFLVLGIQDKWEIKIKNNVISWVSDDNRVTKNLIPSSFGKTNNESTPSGDLITFFKLSQPIKDGVFQHFFWKYNDTSINRIKRIIQIQLGFDEYNKLMNIVELKNSIPIVINLRNSNQEDPRIENSKKFKTQNNEVIITNSTPTNKSNWFWIIKFDPNPIKLKGLYPPLEKPEIQKFKHQNKCNTNLIVVIILFTILIILTLLFIIYPYIHFPVLPNPPEPLEVSSTQPNSIVSTPIP